MLESEQDPRIARGRKWVKRGGLLFIFGVLLLSIFGAVFASVGAGLGEGGGSTIALITALSGLVSALAGLIAAVTGLLLALNARRAKRKESEDTAPPESGTSP